MIEINKDTNKKFDSEELGEVELAMKYYHSIPRPISLRFTWAQLTELALGPSFDSSVEEMLMHRAFQEIKSIEGVLPLILQHQPICSEVLEKS